MVENSRHSSKGKMVLSKSSKSVENAPIEQRASRKRKLELGHESEENREESPDSSRESPIRQGTGSGYPPLHLRSSLGIRGCRSWSMPHPTNNPVGRKRSYYGRSGDDLSLLGDKHPKPTLVEMIEDHLEGRRAAGYSEKDSLVHDDSENAVDKATRVLLSGVFTRDLNKLLHKDPLEKFQRASLYAEKVISFSFNHIDR
jgi:hypothetical protein